MLKILFVVKMIISFIFKIIGYYLLNIYYRILTFNIQRSIFKSPWLYLSLASSPPLGAGLIHISTPPQD